MNQLYCIRIRYPLIRIRLRVRRAFLGLLVLVLNQTRVRLEQNLLLKCVELVEPLTHLLYHLTQIRSRELSKCFVLSSRIRILPLFEVHPDCLGIEIIISRNPQHFLCCVSARACL